MKKFSEARSQIKKASKKKCDFTVFGILKSCLRALNDEMYLNG